MCVDIHEQCLISSGEKSTYTIPHFTFSMHRQHLRLTNFEMVQFFIIYYVAHIQNLLSLHQQPVLALIFCFSNNFLNDWSTYPLCWVGTNLVIILINNSNSSITITLVNCARAVLDIIVNDVRYQDNRHNERNRLHRQLSHVGYPLEKIE